jgi:hypothetical protein
MDLSRLSTSELKSIASGNMKDLSTETLKMISGQSSGVTSKEEPGLGKQAWKAAKDVGNTVIDVGLALPRGVAKGAASVIDMATYPVRKPLETLLNREIPTLEEGAVPQYEPTTSVGKIVHKGGQYGGSMLGGAGVGTSLVKAGFSATPKIVSKSAPLYEKALTKGRNLITNPAELFGNPKSGKELAELGKLGGATGLLSGSLEEAGINPLVADIGAGASLLAHPIYKTIAQKKAYKKTLNSIETKALQDLEAKIGSENVNKVLGNLNQAKESGLTGYQPTTAELANNTGFSQFHRAHEGHYPEIADVQEKGAQVLRNSLEGLTPKKGDVRDLPGYLSTILRIKEGKTKAAKTAAEEGREVFLSRLKGNHNPEKTGEVLRTGIEHQLTARERLRRQKTAPLYEALDAIESPASAKNSHEYISETINDVGIKEPIKNDFLAIKKALVPNKVTHEQKKLLSDIEKAGYPDELKTKILEQTGLDLEGLAPTPRELNNARKLVDRKITLARKSGDHERAYYLSELKANVIQDLEPFPEAAKATKTYREYSKPISEITSDRALKKDIDQDVYKNAYKIGPAEIPDLFTKSASSIRNSKNLMAVLKRDKKSMNALKEHTYQDFLSTVVGEDGEVKISSVRSWMRNHPGARVIDSGFKKNADTLIQAQRMVENAAFKLKNFNKLNNSEAFKDVLGTAGKGVDQDKIINNVLAGKNRTNKMIELIGLVKQDKSGKAMQGLQKAIIDDIVKKSSLSSVNAQGSNNLSYDKIRRYLDGNKDALKQVLTKDQLETLHKVENILKKRSQVQSVGRTVGSPTSSNLNLSVLETATQSLKPHVEASAAHALLDTLSGGPSFTSHLLKGAREYRKNKKNVFSNQKKEVIERLLSRPSEAKEMLTRFKAIPESSPPFSLANEEKKALLNLGTQNMNRG